MACPGASSGFIKKLSGKIFWNKVVGKRLRKRRV
nr:MAG TPA: hypothetical protein [Caudoviricetes sp.]